MTLLTGTYYDGVSSRGYVATIEVLNNLQATLVYDEQRIHIQLSRLKIEPSLGGMPRKITWQETGFFAADATIELDQLVRRLDNSSMMDWVASLEKRVGVIIAATIGTLIFILGFGIYGVPKLAEATAYILPEGISARLASSTLEKLDLVLDESALSAERQAQLSEYFLARGEVEQLFFRHAQRVGANAFTLSKSTVVFTDDLVQLTSDDEELLAVYLHELGHAKLLHVERSILQSVAWAVILTMITGDIGGVGELLLALPLTLGQAAYSREHEREADKFAIAELKSLGISPLKLISILDQIEASHSFSHEDDLASSVGLDGVESKNPDLLNEQDANAENAEDARDLAKSQENEFGEKAAESIFSRSLLELLSSHPITVERRAYIRAAAEDN
jgi:Zn-dependent protease with chaperone function